MASILFVPVAFAVASGWLYLLICLAPEIRGVSGSEDTERSLKFPDSLEELREVASLLHAYHHTNPGLVFSLFCSAYLYKQTFAIPGSFFMNILAGALFGMWIGFPLACILTACGASFCFLLSKHCGKQYIQDFFPAKVAVIQNKVEENQHRLLFFLLFLRLFPVTPNWFLNMASPIVNIPIHLFSLSVFIGLMPYNYICVQTGVLLSEIRSLDDIFSTSTLLKLGTVAIAALLPGLILKRQRMKTS